MGRTREVEFLNTLIQKYLGTILAAATIGLVTGGTAHLVSFYALAERVETMEVAHASDTEASKKREEDIQKTLGNVVDVLKQIQAQQEEFKGMILTPTVVGRGTVGDFAPDIAFVDVSVCTLPFSGFLKDARTVRFTGSR